MQASIKQEKTGNINQISLVASKDDTDVTSAVITFNKDKIRLSDRVRKTTYRTWAKFDHIEDSESTLSVYCYDETIEALYDGTYDDFSSKVQESVELTEMKEISIGGNMVPFHWMKC